MKSFFFVTGDFLRANLRQSGLILAWAASVGLVLMSATAIFGLPPYQAKGTVETQRFFLLTLSPLLSEAEINRLGWTIWAWPEVTKVAFRLLKENAVAKEERALLVELGPAASGEEVAGKLRKLSGIVKVTVFERTVVPPRVPSSARISAVFALVAGLVVSFFLGFRATVRAQARWRQERELLRGSGLSPVFWRGPTFFLAGLAGLLGAGVHLVALWVGIGFIPPDPVWTQFVAIAPWATALGIPAGIALGVLSAVLTPHS